MLREIKHALTACLATFILCAVAYPAALWVVGKVAFPKQAEGSLIERDGKVIGSRLIAQPFASDKYFQPRPSAAGPNGYAADAASGSNLGTKNPALRERVIVDVAKQIVLHDHDAALKALLDGLDASSSELKAKNEVKEKSQADTDAIAKLEDRVSTAKSQIRTNLEARKSTDALVPVDLVTTSGAGLDPDVSLEGARYQAARIAAARGLSVARVDALIDAHTDHSGRIIGAPPRVNVLLLNLSLDEEKADPKSTSKPPAADPVEMIPAPETKSAIAVTRPAPESLVSQDSVESLAERVARLQARVDTIPVADLTSEITELKGRVGRLASDARETTDSVKTIGRLDSLVASLDREVKATRAEVKAAREVAKNDAIPDAIEVKFRSLRSEVDALRNSLKKDGTTAVAAPAPKRDLDLIPAIKLFQTKQYAGASSAFRALTQAHPDDARTWYYAAVSTGLATNQWRGETEELVNKGVARERAGTPSSIEIDAALTGLTKETGQEWLAYYRSLASRR